MYREIISRRRIPIIICTFIGITAMLYIREMAYLLINSKNDNLNEINIVCIISIITLMVLELRIAMVSYKYSIIAGKLIINKIAGKTEKNIVSIKISNIVYLGNKNNLPDEYKKVPVKNNFCCQLFKRDKNICIYENENTMYAFYFCPSKKFKDKVKIYV